MANPTLPTGVTMSTYTKSPAATVANVSGLPTGAASGDAIIRSADMSLWDSTNNLYVRTDQTNIGLNQ